MMMDDSKYVELPEAKKRRLAAAAAASSPDLPLYDVVPMEEGEEQEEDEGGKEEEEEGGGGGGVEVEDEEKEEGKRMQVEESIVAALETITMVQLRLYWGGLKEVSELIPQLYDTLLKAVVHMNTLFYDKEFLYRVGGSYTYYKQQMDLWKLFLKSGLENGFYVEREKDSAIWDVCEMIVQTKIDRSKYPLITEFDVASMATVLNIYFGRPSIKQYSYRDYRCMKIAHCTDDAIKLAVSGLESPSKFTVDQYTSFLKALVVDNDVKYLEDIFKGVVHMINIEALYSMDTELLSDLSSKMRGWRKDELDHEFFDFMIRSCLKEAASMGRKMLVNHLGSVEVPLLKLCASAGCNLSLEVYQLVIVAELRRKAEGSQFISTKHFLWAFTDGGYELPAEITNAVGLSSDDDADHPPYHIYGTCIRLAKHLGDKFVQPAHLAVAVGFGMHVNNSPEQLTDLRNSFNRAFPDGLKRRQSAADEVVLFDDPATNPLKFIFISERKELSLKEIKALVKTC